MPFFRRRRKTTAAAKLRRRDIPDGLWLKCPTCTEMIFRQELEENLYVCPKCGHHFQLDRGQRLALLTEAGFEEEWDTGLTSADPLAFTGAESYVAKLETAVKKTGVRKIAAKKAAPKRTTARKASAAKTPIIHTVRLPRISLILPPNWSPAA